MLPAVFPWLVKLGSRAVGPWGLSVLIVAAAAAVWGHGASWGLNRAQAQAAAALELREREHDAAVTRLAREAAETDVVWFGAARGVEEGAAAQRRRIPSYVPPSDRDCRVPAGLVRLWNDPLSTGAALYQPAVGDAGAAAGMAAAEFADTGIIEAKRRFELNRLQCARLQAWARSIEEGRRGQ